MASVAKAHRSRFVASLTPRVVVEAARLVAKPDNHRHKAGGVKASCRCDLRFFNVGTRRTAQNALDWPIPLKQPLAPYRRTNSGNTGEVMYAIIKDGGRQYKVEEGQELEIDLRSSTTAGDEIKFDSVLALGGGEDGMKLGTPLLESASVTGEVLGVKMGPKLVVQKFRRRKNSRRKTGHRQMYTRVRIGKIEG